MNLQSLHSEEDVRSKVVLPWLESHGFTSADILVERSFNIRLGRNVFRVENGELVSGSNRTKRNPRLDVLVRAKDGRNLMIIEVKAPHEALDEEAKEQGISYARVLREGGIAPFVVLTNGTISKVFDTITGEQLDGEGIPLNHPHVRAGFRVCADDLNLRVEAIEKIVSLSGNNLLAFCAGSTASRMNLLRSEDIHSGKKYVPSLYVARDDPEKQFKKLLAENARVILIYGKPQVGKTNFVCHKVEEMIDQGEPCLFYAAVSMQGGLLEEIRDDFGWLLHEVSDPIHVVQKLTALLRSLGQKLVIFVDGWNEADRQIAHAIGQASERLACDEVTVVLSMTNVAAQRLLLDSAGNCSYVAEATGIGHAGVPLIELSPESLSRYWKAVLIGDYTPAETIKTYAIYSATYSVSVPKQHKAISDPFLLRIAMEEYENRKLPLIVNEPPLIRKSLQRKAERAGTLRDAVPNLLTELCQEIFDNGAPVKQNLALKRWNYSLLEPLPSPLFEAALLIRRPDENGLSLLDFYSERDRNFILSHWAADWKTTLSSNKKSVECVGKAMRTTAGIESLRWFLSQENYSWQLQIVYNSCFGHMNSVGKRIVLACLCVRASQHEVEDFMWMENAARQALAHPDSLVKLQALKLLVLILERNEDNNDYEEITEILEKNLDFVPDILRITEEFPLSEGSVGRVALYALRDLHHQKNPGDGESYVTAALRKLLDDPECTAKEAVASSFGFIAPYSYLRVLSDFIISGNAHEELDSFSGIYEAVDQMREIYHGGMMCRGSLDVLRGDRERLTEEYLRMRDLCLPIIKYWPDGRTEDLRMILDDLRPDSQYWDNDHDNLDFSPSLKMLESWGQLRLPFNNQG